MLKKTSVAFLTVLAPFCAAVVYDATFDALPLSTKHDYVIVGGGVAGSVVANRLTENSNVSVLLLEAGPFHKGVIETEVPFYFWLGIPSTYQWNYTTVPQSSANNRSIAYPRGHILGGSSAINGLVYDRAATSDFDKLANMSGDSGWAWESMLTYYEKLETFGPPSDGHNITDQFDPSVHGFSGPLGVSLPGYSQTLDSLVLETLNNGTFPYNQDSNSGNEIGFGWQVSTIHNGTRTTAATAYLADNYLARPNLDVVVNAFVTRVLASNGSQIDTVEFHAVGNTTNLEVQASQEVIMSAGSINTPYILLSSGIGDNATLSSMNITPIHHLPSVGQNMSDTTVMYVSWEVNSNDTFDPLLNNETARAEAFSEWNATRTGRMANGVINLSGMLRMNDSDPTVQSIYQQYSESVAGSNDADFEMLFIDGYISTSNSTYFSMLYGVLSPLSRGSITLNASDPLGPPLIDPNYFASEYDVLVMRQALLTGFNFLSSEPWTSYLGTPVNGLAEVISAVGTGDFTAMDQLMRNGVQNGAHLVATSSMSPYGADWGVVDPDLRVKGLDGLRVVDASVYPFVPGGATQLPTYCLAERASDIIKGSQ
ncbi:pyranose dehydrogenase [Lentinula edodes]|uniref:Pyranose dehydrogenase n=1 Tax=Lentinula lateritia TaxID=40482 RepID=A0A9W9A257_9AGAR|nr:pyranose dehydrogenase [Lentinula edodes]